MTLQHQDVNAGSFTLTTQDAAQGQSVQVDPRAQQAFQYTASGASGAVGVVSNWGQGYVRSDLQGGVPSKFVVGANGLLPGEGSVSTMGTGITGPARILIGDNGRVPNIQGEGLDARCLQQGDARMAFALPAVKLSNWELGGGACSSWLDVPGDLKHVVVETANNLLDIILAILDSDPTLGPGAGVQVLDTGVHHSATSRFKVLDEHIECPDKMQFIEPVEWLQVQAGDAAPDLVIDLNPKPRPSDGKLFETIEIKSPSKQVTDYLRVQSKTETVTQEQSFEAQLWYLSPFNNLDVWVGDRSMFQTAEGLHTDQVMGLLNGGLNYHTHFTDLQRFEGDVQHLECGSRDEINVEYERIPGRPEHDVSFWMDLGAGCDKQRFDVEPFPVTLDYRIDWEDLCDNSIQADLGGPIDALHWWRSAHRFCPFADVPVNLEPAAGAAWYIEALEVPSGRLDVGIKMGKAGRIIAQSQTDTIGHLGFGISAGRGSDVYSQAGFNNVDLRMEWDLDGDTRQPGNPRYVFIDTGGEFMEGSQRVRMGPVGFGHGLGQVRFEDFQIGMKWKTKSFIEYPVFYRNGNPDIAASYTAELMVNDRWYRFPAGLY